VRRRFRLILAACGLSLLAFAAAAEPAPPFRPVLPADTTLRALAFSDLSGWMNDDHAAALAVFRDSCRAVLVPAQPPAGLPPPVGLTEACRQADTVPSGDRAAARAFFERGFTPYEVAPPVGHGFLTGYYEPEVPGSLVRTPEFTAPLIARPSDLVTLEPGETAPGLPLDFSAARRLADGRLAPFPDRGAILDGALGGDARPLVWLSDAVEVFLVQVQGSTRVRLPDGSTRRFAYDGKNGLPYTSVGREIVKGGHVPLEELTLERLKAFLRADPALGDRLMRRNQSYVFFREATELPADKGPRGASGVSLTPLRSIAVDRRIWPYGLPVWLEASLPRPDGASMQFRHLTMAQDTGSAIVGPARVDLFVGTGEAAGTAAGLLRQPVRFVVLLPKPHP
jgi:membrane-bound lytic murein transglycosylase A